MERITGFATRFPKSVIAATMLVTVAAMALLVKPGIEMDANPYPLNKRHPSMVAFHELKTDFTGTLETGLVHLRHPRTIFNADTFERIAAVTEGLEALELDTTSQANALAAMLPVTSVFNSWKATIFPTSTPWESPSFGR